ncbi:MAG: SAM-dependent methyltransferase [Gammaproteobacteria bacterium]|nr:SAM-dependent methyltransferase [Gammaproteobacteria bacterium]
MSLPEPGADVRACSEQLTRVICAEIAREQRITFHRFMELALYTPELGYYMNGLRKFGPDGDFITAPEISPLFSRCVAHQCAQILRACKQPTVLEAGAGSGVMAADILLELERLDTLPQRYAILELSASLRARQHETLQTRAAHLASRVVWLEHLPETAFEGVILANELLDAMPVHRVRLTMSGAMEQYVTWNRDHFVWCDGPLSDTALRARIAALPQNLPANYTTEINLNAEAWLRTFAPLLQRGAVLLFDYGFPAPEYYHPQRNDGTLVCHYRHRVHNDPLTRVGLQDITSHIDFTALAHAAHDSGLHVAGFSNQTYFLLSTGIDRFVNEHATDVEHWRVAQQIQKLTSPAEMGELFKVLALTRDLDLALEGFTFRDQRARL